MPPIEVAPQPASGLRIFVWNASHDAARVAGESTVTGYTVMLREAVQRQLVRAGFTLVSQPSEPHDLVARAFAEIPAPVGYPGTGTMVLIAPDGRVIDQVSAVLVIDENVNIDERGPVELVNRASRSARIAEYARDHTRPACETIAPTGDTMTVVR
jgi:hypothetical protein